ncbi:MAG: ATP-binding protein [Chloroflexi bacterium HGW-Chloroflexi-3]|nr:MAG: ATP-binding protein [Chloroflexi bacterium HGW-Chloroflexi-3]
MKELSLHLMDISENSINANASHVTISIDENTLEDRLTMSVKDNGNGMTPDMTQKIIDPFTTSRTTRKVGLGIPLLKAAAEMCNGFLKISSQPGEGTELIAQFQRSHIDRMPLGDMAGTILHLVVGSPATHWTFKYKVNDANFEFDDQIIKAELDGIPLSEPMVLSFIRNEITNGIKNISINEY